MGTAEFGQKSRHRIGNERRGKRYRVRNDLISDMEQTVLRKEGFGKGQTKKG